MKQQIGKGDVMKNSVTPLLIILLASFLGAMGVMAQENPVVINYQGYLTDNTGKALSGTHEITFLLYDRSEGGDALWSEMHSVIVDDGLFVAGITGASP